jgi:hypothetical protein
MWPNADGDAELLAEQHIRNFLLSRGYFVSKTSRDGDIQDLLDRLAPQETDKKLLRLGGETDGGYLVPDDLEGIEYCFSPGVAETARFESDLAERGVRSFLADYSVERPPVESEMLHFEKRYLGSVDDGVFMTLGSWVERSLPNHDGDLLLQMDIEGSEYDVVFETPDSVWKRFRIAVIEFHGLHTAFNKYGLRLLRSCFQKLLRNFEIVHMHPNNGMYPLKRGSLEVPGLMEITFLRKDRVQTGRRATAFPHALDRPNFPDKRDVVLPACWYR